MADFDPDAYLATKSEPAFDPDAYLRSAKKSDFSWGKLATDIPTEIGNEVSGGAADVKALGNIGQMGSKTSFFDPQGTADKLMAVPKAALGAARVAGSWLTGPVKSVVGHGMANLEHLAGSYINPEVAAKDNPETMYETAKHDVDLAMSAGRPKGFSPAGPRIGKTATPPNALANQNAADEFGIRLSKGQATEDLDTIRYEDMAARGAYGKEQQDRAADFFRKQYEDSQAAGRDVGDQTARTSPVVENPSEAASAVQGEVADRAARARTLQSQAEQAAATEAQSQRGIVSDQQRALDESLRGGALPIENTREAGEVVGQNVRDAAAANRADFRARYNEFGNLPGEFRVDAVRGLGDRVQNELTFRDEPVIIDDQLTPVSSRAIRDLNEMSAPRIQNRADPRAAPNPDEISAVSLRGIDQMRKKLVAYYRSARASGPNGATDARAMQAIMNGFDGQIERAITENLFSGDPRALEALQEARASYSRYRQQFTPQGAGDDVGIAMRRIIERGATPEETANMIVGSGKIGSTGTPVRLFDRLEQVLGDGSDAISAIRQAMWQKASQVRNAAGAIDPAKSAASIDAFAGSTLARRAFTQQELNAMRAHARAVRDLESNIEQLPATQTAERVRSAYQDMFGGNDLGGTPAAAFRRMVEGTATPEEITNGLFKVIGAGNPGNVARTIQAIENIVGHDSPTMGAIRQGVWQRLTQEAAGKDQPGAQKAMQAINGFLNGTGRTIAQQLYSADELVLMDRYAKALKLTIIPKYARTNSDTAPAMFAAVRKYAGMVGSALGIGVHGGASGGLEGYAVGKLLDKVGDKFTVAKANKRLNDSLEGFSPSQPKPTPAPGKRSAVTGSVVASSLAQSLGRMDAIRIRQLMGPMPSAAEEEKKKKDKGSGRGNAEPDQGAGNKAHGGSIGRARGGSSKASGGAVQRAIRASKGYAEGGAPELSDDDQAAMMPETFVPEGVRKWTEQAAPKDYNLISGSVKGMATLPQRAIESARNYRETGEYDPGPILEAATLPMGTGAIAGLRMAPREVALGAGPIRAYHGSPHDFDAFSMDKIGTGEGAQAYGHGLYFADSEGVAKSYRDALSGKNMTLDGASYNTNDPLHNAAAVLDKFNGDRDAALKWLDGSRIMAPTYEALKSGVDLPKVSRPGHMYEVNINADPSHFLDWDKPLSQQPQGVKDALGLRMTEQLGPSGYLMKSDKLGGWHNPDNTGGAFYQGSSAATDRLREAGIPGIKYLDQGSRQPSFRVYQEGDKHYVSQSGANSTPRAAGPFATQEEAQAAKSAKEAETQTRNYVVFNHDLINIVRKYALAGIALPPAIAAAYEQMQQNGRATGGAVSRAVRAAKGYETGGAPDDIDWSRMNQPFGSITSEHVPVSTRIGDTAQEGLVAAGMKPYAAQHLREGVGGLLDWTGAPNVVDTVEAQSRGDKMGVVKGMAGMIPGVRQGLAPVKAAIERGATNAAERTGEKAGLDVARDVAGASGGTGGLEEAQAAAARHAGAYEPLEGLPRGPFPVGGEPYVPGPIASVHDVAKDYMASTGRPYVRADKYHPVDPEKATAIARAFDEMEHAPDNPKVKASYNAMIKETRDQFDAAKRSGVVFEPIPADMPDPYAATPRLAAKDVQENNHLWYFPSDQGFGTAVHGMDMRTHPMMQPSGRTDINGKEMLNNDLFRVVHDYFGHLKEGNGFRAAGEDNAWRTHANMYSDLAKPAMTTETRGQNSWVNYGPHGEANRNASAANTVYADQKVGVMPDWVVKDLSGPERKAAPRSGIFDPNTGLPVKGKAYSATAKDVLQDIAAGPKGAGPLDLTSQAMVPDVPQRALERYDPPRGISPRLQEALQSKEVKSAIEGSVKAGMKIGADKWYHTEPVRRAFTNVLGEEKGNAAFGQYMDMVAATSPRSDVPTNIRNASFYYGHGQNASDLPGSLPYPYGHVAQNLHRQNYETLMSAPRAGVGADVPMGTAWDIFKNPKPASFAENLRGNLAPVTVDTHAFRNIAMRTGDPRFLETSISQIYKPGVDRAADSLVQRYGEVKGDKVTFRPQKLLKEGKLSIEDAKKIPTFWASKPNENEYGAAEKLYSSIAGRRRIAPADAQAAAWAGAGDLTGLGTVPTHTFPELFNERVLFTSKMRGENPQETLEHFISGRKPLLNKGGAVKRDGGGVMRAIVASRRGP